MISPIWSREEEKTFENAIAMHWRVSEKEAREDDDEEEDEALKEQWEKIASMVPSKSMAELKRHYRILVDDVTAILAGQIPVPNYTADDSAATLGTDVGSSSSQHSHGLSGSERRGNSGHGNGVEQERRKIIPWTEEEHRLFLLGLEQYGKGDWRSISRKVVISRNPAQVASHAQKYFNRLNSVNRDRPRSSIHDITSVSNGQGPPITGQQTVGAPAPAPAANHPHYGTVPGMGMYGPPMGNPVATRAGHMGSAVGAPAMLPPGHHQPPPYVVPFAYPTDPPDDAPMTWR